MVDDTNKANEPENGVKKSSFSERYVSLILKLRVPFLVLILVGTAIFGYYAAKIKIATDFVSFYPPNIRSYNFTTNTEACSVAQTSWCWPLR